MKKINPISAFTMIELVIIITIIGILSAIVTPRLGAIRSDASGATLMADTAAVRTAIARYYSTNKTYPGTATLWNDLTKAPNDFLSAIPKNPINSKSELTATTATASLTAHGYYYNGATGDFGPVVCGNDVWGFDTMTMTADCAP